MKAGIAVCVGALGIAVALTAVARATEKGASLPASPAVGPAGQVQLVKQVYLERISRGVNGAERVILVPADRYAPGDRLVFVTRYRNDSPLPVRNYVVANPVPAHVRVDPPTGAMVEVSVDGGRRWGPLQALLVGKRRATPDDVTHVRWILAQAMAPGESGQFSYRGTVR